jgi:hypothetical protein
MRSAAAQSTGRAGRTDDRGNRSIIVTTALVGPPATRTSVVAGGTPSVLSHDRVSCTTSQTSV